MIYHKKEENRLINLISSSKLISKEILLEIKKTYNENVPYHNFIHALQVSLGVLNLDIKNFSIIEIKSLLISALFHDAGHTGKAGILDEFISLDICLKNIEKFEKKYNYYGIDYSVVRSAIIGTVFKNRGKGNRYAKILADLDISSIGSDFSKSLYYAFIPLMLELKLDYGKYYKHNINFIKFLISKNKNIFFTSKFLSTYNQSYNNFYKYLKLEKKDFEKIFYIWNNDIDYTEFKQKIDFI